MTELLADPDLAGRWCAEARAGGRTLGFVPTMGALHAGHLALVERAQAENDRVCVSVFVNPLQFDERSDFDRYPRDFEADARMVEKTGCAMVFTGTLEQFFPGGVALRDPGPRSLGLEGDLRPGHFAGVATIVSRLFAIVRPDRAYFGQKDFQQTLVVADLARSMGYPQVVVCPTVREETGLAMSSRNERLAPVDRAAAAALSRSLDLARTAWRKGAREAGELARVLRHSLAGTPLSVEYATVRDPETWTREEPEGRLERAVALVAARIAGVRLIDNMLLHER